ncbi:MAG: App1 family protein [Gammaproteobacteria bacterium]|nr:App1 family protein [Gammaproteobacteria bacterium]
MNNPCRRFSYGCRGLAGLLLLPIAVATAAPLQADDEILLFPTSAYYDSTDQHWHVPVHAWVFQSKPDSWWRTMSVHAMAKMFGLDDDIDLEHNGIFRTRARRFFADNQPNRQFQLRIADRSVALPSTGENGHALTTLQLSAAQVAGATQSQWLPVTVTLPAADQDRATTDIQLLRPSGVSVISDIDDTIKISQVLNKKQLLHNTFVREYEAVPAMSTVYHYWQLQGADFQYVSASPWQLYPELNAFLERSGFPRGSMVMKQFRLNDASLHNLFVSPYEYKLPILTELLQRCPQRQFILVGDSGEKDPEVYASLLQRFPAQIKHIYIRDVTHEPINSARYPPLFPGARPPVTVFEDATELLKEKI